MQNNIVNSWDTLQRETSSLTLPSTNPDLSINSSQWDKWDELDTMQTSPPTTPRAQISSLTDLQSTPSTGSLTLSSHGSNDSSSTLSIFSSPSQNFTHSNNVSLPLFRHRMQVESSREQWCHTNSNDRQPEYQEILSEEVEDLRLIAKIKESQIIKLKSQVSELMENVDAQIYQGQTKDAKLEQHQREMRKMMDEIERMKCKMDALEKTNMSQLQDEQVKLESLQRRLGEKHRENCELKNREKLLREREKEWMQVQDKIRTLNQQVNDLQTSCQNVERKLKDSINREAELGLKCCLFSDNIQRIAKMLDLNYENAHDSENEDEDDNNVIGKVIEWNERLIDFNDKDCDVTGPEMASIEGETSTDCEEVNYDRRIVRIPELELCQVIVSRIETIQRDNLIKTHVAVDQACSNSLRMSDEVNVDLTCKSLCDELLELELERGGEPSESELDVYDSSSSIKGEVIPGYNNGETDADKYFNDSLTLINHENDSIPLEKITSCTINERQNIHSQTLQHSTGWNRCITPIMIVVVMVVVVKEIIISLEYGGWRNYANYGSAQGSESNCGVINPFGILTLSEGSILHTWAEELATALNLPSGRLG